MQMVGENLLIIVLLLMLVRGVFGIAADAFSDWRCRRAGHRWRTPMEDTGFVFCERCGSRQT